MGVANEKVDAPDPSTPTPGPRGPNMRTRLLVLVSCLVAGLLAVEGIMRYLLFDPGEMAVWWGRDLRHPELFAAHMYEDEYWRLEWLLRVDEKKAAAPLYDELLGWTSGRVRPGTYDYRIDVKLAERRPILMYGASYTDCITGNGECFPRLLADSPLHDRYALYNFGVGGHGCGQTLTLMRQTLDRFVEQNPVVVIGLVADNDFQRCSLEFRSWPKLKLVRQGEELVPSGPVPAGGPAPYIETHGTGIGSYAWRYLLYAPGVLPRSWQHALRASAAQQDEQDALVQGIVLAMRDELEERGLEYFFILSTSPRTLPPRDTSHLERLLVRLLDEEQIPYASGRRYVEWATGHFETELDSLFFLDGAMRNHPNLEGNLLIFEALKRGLGGKFSPPDRPWVGLENRVHEGRNDRRGLKDDEYDGSGKQQGDHGSEPPVRALPERDE